MKYSKRAWQQLKSKTAGEIIAALEKDRWALDEAVGAGRVYLHPDGRRVGVHYHPKKTYGPYWLKRLLDDIGWTEDDLHRLKLIK